MEKIKRDQEIFGESKDTVFLYADIKHLSLQDEDELNFQFIEDYFSENNSYNGRFVGVITRKILETDEELEKRKQENEKLKLYLKDKRREHYLRLKNEFENEIL